MYCFEPRSTIGPGRELRIKEVACCSEFEFRSRWRADFKFRPRSRETKFRGGAVRGVSLICVCVARLPRCDRGGHGSNRRSHEWQSRRNQSGCSQINADVAADAVPRFSAKTGGKYPGLSLLFLPQRKNIRSVRYMQMIRGAGQIRNMPALPVFHSFFGATPFLCRRHFFRALLFVFHIFLF